MPLTTVFLGLGSNIEPRENMAACAELLRADYPGIVFSSVYGSAAREEVHQADFLNAVARMETDETPEEVQTTLREIELFLGKNPPFPKGPRTIDLDILLYGTLTTSPSEDLAIPHPRMHERRFVLEPLCELLEPQTTHPVLGTSFGELLKETANQDCVRTNMAL